MRKAGQATHSTQADIRVLHLLDANAKACVCLVIAEVASYLSGMQTLLLLIGTVLRSRIIQRKGLGAIPAICMLVRYWWIWTPPLPEARSERPLRLAHQDETSKSVYASGQSCEG